MTARRTARALALWRAVAAHTNTPHAHTRTQTGTHQENQR